MEVFVVPNNITASLFFSEGVENMQQGFNQRLSIVNPFVTMVTPFIPTALTFNVNVVLSGVVKHEKYHISLQLVHLETKEVAFLQEFDDFMIPEQMENLNMNFDMKNVPFRHDGIYQATFKIDEHVTHGQMILKLANAQV